VVEYLPHFSKAEGLSPVSASYTGKMVKRLQL